MASLCSTSAIYRLLDAEQHVLRYPRGGVRPRRVGAAMIIEFSLVVLPVQTGLMTGEHLKTLFFFAGKFWRARPRAAGPAQIFVVGEGEHALTQHAAARARSPQFLSQGEISRGRRGPSSGLTYPRSTAASIVTPKPSLQRLPPTHPHPHPRPSPTTPATRPPPSHPQAGHSQAGHSKDMLTWSARRKIASSSPRSESSYSSR